MDDLKTLLKADRLRPRRHRTQAGTVVKRGDGFYLRYYVDGDDGNRTKVSEKIAELGTGRAMLTKLRKARMLVVNAQAKEMLAAQPAELTIGAFYEKEYLPWIRAKKRYSTVFSYESLWSIYIEPAMGDTGIAKFRTTDGYRFLEALAEKLGRNSLQHVRSLCSGIFKRAVNLGVIDSNPWHDVSFAETRAPEPTVAYSMAESILILKALSKRIDAALVFSLAAFLGMRPSEIAGLQWEDIAEDHIDVKRAVVRGVAGETKTPQSQRRLVLIEPVRTLVAAWREQCGGVTSGWLFTGRGGSPMQTDSFTKTAIIPLVEAAGLSWSGLYAARRSCATNLVEMTGDIRSAHQVLGNSLQVAMQKYIKPTTAAGDRGLKLIEAAVQNSKEATQ